jgi:hypothetical protein
VPCDWYTRGVCRVVAVGFVLLALACGRPPSSNDDGTGTTGVTGPTTSSTGESGSSSETQMGTEETGTDELPPTPTLASPLDGAGGLQLETELCWNLVEDPDGEQVRYRVFIDDTVLGGGVLEEEEGHEGPCVGPLLFAYERTYAWRVEAFEADDPTRSSDPSDIWQFSTVGDGLSEQVFADNFDDDLGWELSGDASSGAWVRGDPVAAVDMARTSQPGACAGGSSCYFTGQNPRGLADDADVSGGATVLVSPPFDLSEGLAASVRVQRFFYKSLAGPGPQLHIELLVPNDAAPGGYDAFELELLETDTDALADNLWTPREYVACGLPMAAGSRLRITAVDSGLGILEAAIDSVSVHAYDDATLCESGEGGHCEPGQPGTCPGELLCCSQGALNIGVNRCEPAVAGLDYENPPANIDDPGNGPLGCNAPDLIVDTQNLGPLFADVLITDATCELLEGCVGSTGWRKLLLFTVTTPNIGSADLALGVPANLPELFHYSECHSHYHFDEYARYELRDGDTVVAVGHKQAFCMLDLLSWAWPFELGKFDCSNQGISRGFWDTYDSGLPCQWVDVTGTPPGNYTLHITLNQPRRDHAFAVLNERDYANNAIAVPVSIP